MQKYKNKSEESNIFKSLLLEYLDYLRQRIKDDALTMGELQSLFNAFASNLNIAGTAEDIAKFYEKSPQDVYNVVHRSMLEKPQRKVLYSFDSFRKIAPKKWSK